MARIITSRSDPRLAPYLDMRDRDLRREGDRFLAEGMFVVERAVTAGIVLDSVLVEEGKAERVRGIVGDHAELLVCAPDVLRDTVGFVMHQGVVAAGRIRPALTLEQLHEAPGASPRPPIAAPCPAPGCGLAPAAPTIVVCPEVQNVDNMGLLVRVCAGLGVDAMVLGPSCCDPWYRRAVRVSMGAVFTLPMVRSGDILRDLRRLRETMGYELVATVLDGDALPLKTTQRDDADFPGGMAILLGSEAHGLPPETVDLCHRKVRIPMTHGVDSLNVGVAAGIVAHHFLAAGS